MNLKTKIKTAKNIEEALKVFNENVKELTTVWSKVYTDYNEEWSHHIKAYKHSNGYVTLVKEFEGTSPNKVTFYFTKKEPSDPHPIFPIPHSYLQNPEKIEFNN